MGLVDLVETESANPRCVVQDLVQHPIWSPSALELRHDQPACLVNGEHIRSVAVGLSPASYPTIELWGDNFQSRAQNLGVRQNPLLKIFALPKSRFLKRQSLGRHCF